ncbi:MAG: HAD-IA family hydrolase, partial [Candidatus Saccharimonadaceae bacterium]|nr:HAD-IA family hydrolase [Candidatus Saccharimonadaceae bacterium]
LLSSLSRQPAHEIKEEFETVKRVNPDVIELVKALKVNYRIGLLSNASSSFIREILDENDLEKYFDEIIVSSEAGYIKPNREIYEAALRILRINSSEAIFIDDNRLYIEGAQKIGLDGILFRSADQVARELLERNINFDL